MNNDQDYTPPYGCSLLHGEPNPDKVRSLLDAGMTPNKTCLNGQTALHLSPNAQVTGILIEAGADVMARDLQLNTPLHYVQDAGSVELLVEHGAQVEVKNLYWRTPLQQAGSSSVASALLSKHANPNHQDWMRNTALHLTDSEEIATILLQNGAEVNAKNVDWMTPLHMHGHDPSMTKLLKSFGADDKIVDRHGLMTYEEANKNITPYLSLSPSFFFLTGLSSLFFLLVIYRNLHHKNRFFISKMMMISITGMLCNPLSLVFSITGAWFSYRYLINVPGTKEILLGGLFCIFYYLYHQLSLKILVLSKDVSSTQEAKFIFLIKNAPYINLIPCYAAVILAGINEAGFILSISLYVFSFIFFLMFLQSTIIEDLYKSKEKIFHSIQ